MSFIAGLKRLFLPRAVTAEPLAATKTAAAQEAEGWSAKTRARPEVAPVVRKTGLVLDTTNDFKNDGALLGGDGLIHPPTTPLSKVPPVLPNNGAKVTETILFVNGCMTDVEMSREDLQALANTGAAVVGIQNATRGLVLDVLQCIGDKLDLRLAKNGAVSTAANVIYQALQQGKPLTLVGHSQGALVLSRAISQVERRLMLEDGLSPEAARKKLGQLKVETLGGASARFPDGPSYTHFVNKNDLVGLITGVGIDAINPAGHLGAGAKVELFSEFNAPHNLPSAAQSLTNFFARFVDRTVHGTQEVYFRRRGAQK